MPGPIVVVMVMRVMKTPFAPVGFALTISPTSVAMFSSQLVLLEAHLADRHVDERRAVEPELDAALLGVVHGLGHVVGVDDGAGARVGHQAARAEHAAEAADLAHQVALRERDVELGPAALDLLDQVVAADDVGAGLVRVARAFALGEDEHADGLAQAVRQQRGAAQLLVGVARIERRCACAARRSRRTWRRTLPSRA